MVWQILVSVLRLQRVVTSLLSLSSGGLRTGWKARLSFGVRIWMVGSLASKSPEMHWKTGVYSSSASRSLKMHR